MEAGTASGGGGDGAGTGVGLAAGAGAFVEERPVDLGDDDVVGAL